MIDDVEGQFRIVGTPQILDVGHLHHFCAWTGQLPFMSTPGTYNALMSARQCSGSERALSRPVWSQDPNTGGINEATTVLIAATYYVFIVAIPKTPASREPSAFGKAHLDATTLQSGDTVCVQSICIWPDDEAQLSWPHYSPCGLASPGRLAHGE